VHYTNTAKNPFSVPTMEKNTKTLLQFLQNPDFAGSELIFMLEPAEV
jgi:hypothetical protein